MIEIKSSDPISIKSGFKLPFYAKNIHRRTSPPVDVFYFEIPKENLADFRKSIAKFSGLCEYTPSALSDYGTQFKERFKHPTSCYEKNDGEAITYESLIVGNEEENTPVFYAYWDNDRQ